MLFYIIRKLLHKINPIVINEISDSRSLYHNLYFC